MPNPYAPPDVEPIPDRLEPEHPVAGPPGPRPVIRPGDEFVTLYATGDIVEAEMITNLLESEGIATPGFNRLTPAAMGLGISAVIDHVIRVPASRREEARELLDAWHASVAETITSDADDDEPLDTSRRSGRTRALATVLLIQWLIWPVVAGLAFLFYRLISQS